MACTPANSWEIKVTKLLLSDFDGRAKFNKKFRLSMYQRKLMRGGVSSVHSKLKSSSRFLIFEKEGHVKYASVSLNDAIICCKFRKPSEQTCRKDNCSEYHVCKFFVSGNCKKGSRCHFGHDLQNEANARVSDLLGISSFSTDEIRTIIFRSNPVVCVKYNTGGCDDPACPDLHVCSFSVMQKCAASNNCKLEHALQTSEHNKWVLDTFCLGHLTEVELRRYIIVQNVFQGVTSTGSQSLMTPATSSLSLVSDSTEISEEETEEYILSVFSFLLKRYGGRTKFNTFLCDRGNLLQRLGRADIIEWFKDYSDRFLLYENDGEVTYVAPFNRRARLCFSYFERGTSICKRESCKYLHVCRAFVTGVCDRNTRCGLCHSFSSGPNAEIRAELKLEQFTDREICQLVLCSNPAVCVNYNASGCNQSACPDLHVCSKYILKKCSSGDACKFGHKMQDSGEHNQYVLKAFRMEAWSENVLHAIAIVKGEHKQTVSIAAHIERENPPPLSRPAVFPRPESQQVETPTKTSISRVPTTALGQTPETDNNPAVSKLVKGVISADARSQSQMTPTASSLSLIGESTEVSEEETEECVLSVFSFLLKRYGGRTEFNTFLCDRGNLLQRLGRADIIEWFKDYSDRFLLYENDGEVTYVAPFNRRARLCFSYFERGTSICKRESCKYLHVCRAFVTGTCDRNTRCGLCHSFSSGPNAEICAELKLEQFTDREICQLVLCSNPAVCMNYNASGCNQSACPDLHVCSKYILKKCNSGDACKFGHKMQDSGEHNQYVLKAFRMEAWSENVLHAIAIVKGEHKQTVSIAPHIERGNPPPLSRPAVVPRPESQQTSISRVPRTALSQTPETDNTPADTLLKRSASPSEYTYICEMYTRTGACNNGGCPHYHSPARLPYLWMIRLVGGTWQALNSSESVQLEASFCGLYDDKVLEISLGRNETQRLSVDFNAMSAVGTSLTLFNLWRLSTPSYVTPARAAPPSFHTQWLWYRRERDGSYTPFYPGDLQYTLEEKYLKGQKKYYFEFEDLRLMVNTQRSQMLQVNLDTRRSTRILRRPVFVLPDASEPPLLSSLLLGDIPRPPPHTVPDHWSVLDHFQYFEVVELGPQEAEYNDVSQQFFSTMDVHKYNIVNIFRVQNPGLWDKYCSARRAMTSQGQRPEDVEERQLFHGTPTLQSARGICANSFDFRRAGENVGAVYGKGAYFSTTARYSHSYTRAHTAAVGDPVRFMFLGRNLVGRYTLGHPSYSKPPERERLKLYDSCVNDMTNPTIFVIFDLAQSYPEYLIHYFEASDVEDAVRTLPRLRPASSTTTQNASTATVATTSVGPRFAADARRSNTTASYRPRPATPPAPRRLSQPSVVTAMGAATSANSDRSRTRADLYARRSASTATSAHGPMAYSQSPFTSSHPQIVPVSANTASAAHTDSYDRLNVSYRPQSSDLGFAAHRTSSSQSPTQRADSSSVPDDREKAKSFCTIS